MVMDGLGVGAGMGVGRGEEGERGLDRGKIRIGYCECCILAFSSLVGEARDVGGGWAERLELKKTERERRGSYH